MNNILDQVRDNISAKTTIKYHQKNMYEFFVAEEYPALCLQPVNDREVEGATLKPGSHINTQKASVYYVERAPEDRNMEPYIIKVEEIKATLKQDPQLNGIFPAGFAINIIYHSNIADGNCEFVAEIQIEGRVL